MTNRVTGKVMVRRVVPGYSTVRLWLVTCPCCPQWWVNLQFWDNAVRTADEHARDRNWHRWNEVPWLQGPSAR